MSVYREIGQIYKVASLEQGIDRSSQLKQRRRRNFTEDISLKRGVCQTLCSKTKLIQNRDNYGDITQR